METAFIDYVDQLLMRLSPVIALGFFKAMRDLGRAIDIDTIVRLIEQAERQGQAQAVAERVARQLLEPRVVAAAFAPVQSAIRDVVEKAGTRFYRDIPTGSSAAAPIASVRFNALDPATVTAIEEYESAVLGKLTDTVRETVQQAISEGMRAGVNPRTIARSVVDVLGLTPDQETFLRNYRAELEALASPRTRASLRAALAAGNRPAALARELTDGNIDRTVRSAIAKDRPLTAAEIDKATTRYRKNLATQRAETLTRTVTLNTLREAQRMAWDQAIAAGKFDGDDLEETWITTLDGRERPAHHAMHGARKAYNTDWIVPGVGRQRYPGESEYGCRCRTWIAPRIRP
ncbi:MAG: hypothetical protein ACREBE_02555 [bacterium]